MAAKESTAGFSAEERAAMKERAKELKANMRQAEATQDVLEKIAKLSDADRLLAERLHTLITTEAPSLAPKSWYGMPAYAKDGKIVCFFQAAEKFGTRYATLGFSDQAQLDDGTMWPNSYALMSLTKENEKAIVALITKAVG